MHERQMRLTDEYWRTFNRLEVQPPAGKQKCCGKGRRDKQGSQLSRAQDPAFGSMASQRPVEFTRTALLAEACAAR